VKSKNGISNPTNDAVYVASLILRIFDSCPIKYFSVAYKAVTVTSQNQGARIPNTTSQVRVSFRGHPFAFAVFGWLPMGLQVRLVISLIKELASAIPTFNDLHAVHLFYIGKLSIFETNIALHF
jgi:hypothetical protein